MSSITGPRRTLILCSSLLISNVAHCASFSSAIPLSYLPTLSFTGDRSGRLGIVFIGLNQELHRTDSRFLRFCASLIVAISSSLRVRCPCASQQSEHFDGV